MKYLEFCAVWAHGHIYHCSLGQTTQWYVSHISVVDIRIITITDPTLSYSPLLYSLVIILDRYQLKRKLIPPSLTTHIIHFMFFFICINITIIIIFIIWLTQKINSVIYVYISYLWNGNFHLFMYFHFQFFLIKINPPGQMPAFLSACINKFPIT